MWADMIVLFQPGIDDHLGLFNGRKPFRIEDLSSESAVKAFVISILPRTAGVDLDRLDADL